MSRADALQLVQDISLSQADPVLASHYYDEVLNSLGELDLITALELVEIDADDPIVDLPSQAVRLIGVFYNDSFLNRASVQEVEAFAGNASWQSLKREPKAYVSERESERSFRLFPKPVEPSAAFDFAFGQPLGHDFPLNAAVVVITERRDDLPGWLELPIVFEILAKEYERESDHQDKAFADICREAASLFFLMVL